MVFVGVRWETVSVAVRSASMGLRAPGKRAMVSLEVCMVPNDLIPTLRNLNRTDKLKIMQFLLLELAKEEGITLQAGAEYPVWSPLNATDAANTLLKMLNPHAES